MPCPQCGSGFTIKRKKDGGVFLGCSGYPNCTKTLWLPSELESVSLTGDMCPKCVPKQCRMLNLKFFANRVVPGDPTEVRTESKLQTLHLSNFRNSILGLYSSKLSTCGYGL